MHPRLTEGDGFKLGDIVTVKEFTDSFGKNHPEIRDLTVTKIELIESDWIPYHHRLYAEKHHVTFVATSRFFVHQTPKETPTP